MTIREALKDHPTFKEWDGWSYEVFGPHSSEDEIALTVCLYWKDGCREARINIVPDKVIAYDVMEVRNGVQI